MRKTREIGIVIVLSLVLLLSGCSERRKAVQKYRSLGITELQKENYEAAIDAFRHAMDYYGTAHQDKEEADILSYLAEAEYRAGKYEEALEHYEQLLRKGGRKAAYLDLACAAAVKAGKGMEGALPYYEEAEKKTGNCIWRRSTCSRRVRGPAERRMNWRPCARRMKNCIRAQRKTVVFSCTTETSWSV